MSVTGDWENTEEALLRLQNELKCKICKSLAKNPVKFGMCGDFFCRSCVDDGSCICPSCGVASRASEVSPDKTVKDLVTGWRKIAAIVNPIRFGVASADDDASTKSSASSSSKPKRGRLGTALKASTAHNKIPVANKEPAEKSQGEEKTQAKPKLSKASTESKKRGRPKKLSESSTATSNTLDQNEEPTTEQTTKIETIKKPLPVAKKRSISKERNSAKKGSNVSQMSEDLDGTIMGTPKPPATPRIKTPKCHTPAKTLVKRNYKGETPLHVACIKGNVVNVKSLLAAGANPNTKDNAGWTPLHEAVSKGFAEVVELLLDAGALVDVPGVDNMTPLHEAVASGRTALVRMLVSRGANTRARNSAGKTPWDFAVTTELKEALETSVLSQNSGKVGEPTMDLTDKEMVVCCVGLDKASKRDFLALSAKLNIRVAANFTPDVSHLIVATDKCNVCPPSLDVLSAILCGCWIVNRDWLSISQESNETVEPSLFEIRGLTDYVSDGPRRGRLNAWKQLPGLFNGCHFYLLNNAQTKIGDCFISRKDFMTLIKYGGGVLLSREPRPEDIPEKEKTVPYHTAQRSDLEHTSHYIIYGEAKAPALKYNMVHIKTLSAEWLVGCIANFKLLDP